MVSVGKRKRRPRREFTSEFKADIVELYRSGERTVPQIVADFDLVDSAVRRWIEQADAHAEAQVESGVDRGDRVQRLSASEKSELVALREENARLRQDVELLKRATAFFAKETR